jgi:formylglycine-generating enzyme required for sulfatase activity
MYRSISKLLIALSLLIGGGANLCEAQPPKEFTNSIGMKLVLIPKGTFMMGSPETEKGRFGGETLHEVTLTKDFYLGVFEVKQVQYELVMKSDPSKKKALDKNLNQIGPVENVSWTEATEFCKRLSESTEEKKSGRTYRLPTEAEWEYACRAGSTTAFCYGDDENTLGEYAQFDEVPLFRYTKGGAGLKKPNPWGLHDMHGNVWEWCSDWHAEDPEGSQTDPHGADSGKYRIRRGGSFMSSRIGCRSAVRVSDAPDYKWETVGFRVALTLESPPETNR